MTASNTFVPSVSELKRLSDIGGSALELGRFKEAETICAAIVPFCPPRSPGPSIALAVAVFAQGDSDAGMAILRDRVLTEMPEFPDALAQLALMLRSQGRLKEANDCLDRARLQPMSAPIAELIDDVSSGRLDLPGSGSE